MGKSVQFSPAYSELPPTVHPSSSMQSEGIELGNRLGNELGSSLGSELGSSLGSRLGSSLGSNEGYGNLEISSGLHIANCSIVSINYLTSLLGKSVGSSLGSKLGSSLGSRLGSSLGRNEGYGKLEVSSGLHIANCSIVSINYLTALLGKRDGSSLGTDEGCVRKL